MVRGYRRSFRDREAPSPICGITWQEASVACHLPRPEGNGGHPSPRVGFSRTRQHFADIVSPLISVHNGAAAFRSLRAAPERNALTETTASEARKPRAGRHRKKERRLSAILRELETRPEERISIFDIATAFGDRAFSAILLVFGLLTMAAIVPGTSTVTGAPLFLVATQMIAGRRTLWIPAKLGNRTVAPADIARLNGRFLKFLRRMERLLQPRLPLLFAPLSIRFMGIVCFLLAVIIVLPIPFGNLAPGFSIAIIALAILTRDGLAAIAGVAMAIGSIIFLVVIYGAAITVFLHWIGVIDKPPGPPPGMDGGGPGQGPGGGGGPPRP